MLTEQLATSHPTIYTYVMEHGRAFELQRARRPPKYKDKMCFYNAARLSWDGRFKWPLTYCEGFALSDFGWIHHAWCIDDEDRVIDPTWRPTGLEYFGVPLEPMTVAKLVAGGAMAGEFLERLASEDGNPAAHMPRAGNQLEEALRESTL